MKLINSRTFLKERSQNDPMWPQDVFTLGPYCIFEKTSQRIAMRFHIQIQISRFSWKIGRSDPTQFVFLNDNNETWSSAVGFATELTIPWGYHRACIFLQNSEFKTYFPSSCVYYMLTPQFHNNRIWYMPLTDFSPTHFCHLYHPLGSCWHGCC